MPNWCSNSLTLSHSDPAEISRAVAAFLNNRLLSEFLPCPQDLIDTIAGSHSDEAQQTALIKQQAANVLNYGYAHWYDWCRANWGTKWDVEGGKDFVTVSSDGLSASLRFDSAWVPPTAWYAKIAAQGFNVTAYYWEPGCNFCGMWQNESDNCFEIAGNSDWVEANIPHELNEAMGISETMSEWEQDNEDGNESTTEETV